MRILIVGAGQNDVHQIRHRRPHPRRRHKILFPGTTRQLDCESL